MLIMISQRAYQYACVICKGKTPKPSNSTSGGTLGGGKIGLKIWDRDNFGKLNLSISKNLMFCSRNVNFARFNFLHFFQKFIK